MTYNGLESYILNANSFQGESVTSRVDECPSDSLDEDTSSCSSSSNNASGSFSSHWTLMKPDVQKKSDDWDNSPSLTAQISEMKEKFAKLLLGEDFTGGSKGHSSALALSNSITKLAGAVFGELRKLEPLPEEKRTKWRREMEWSLAPTNYMVELVPAQQYGANGGSLEIMKPKPRGDVHMNLPALRKLDSMLLETLDAMTNIEFWYEEAKGNYPMPQVPIGGLSDGERKKLIKQARLVHQVFKAAKSINETILLEMPIPKIIGKALPKMLQSGKASLGDDLYRTLNTISSSATGMLNSLNIQSEHSALDTINRLEAAIYAWKESILTQSSTKSQARTSWSLKDPSMVLEKIEFLINRAEVLLQQVRIRYPKLPQTFLDVMKIQYGKDIAHAILEAYSRVLGNLAFKILARIKDISQEDVSTDPNSPLATNGNPGVNVYGISSISMSNKSGRSTLIDNIEGKFSLLKAEKASYSALLIDETNNNSVTATPSRGPRCCIGDYVRMAQKMIRRIQVKDIVKEVEDYLKTYSSAEMDISWYVEGIHRGFKESQRSAVSISCLDKFACKLDSTIKFTCSKGPSDTRETKIVALRLKFNAFKALEGEKRANNSIKNDSLAALYGKYHYEEGLIDDIYAFKTQIFTIQTSSSKALIYNNHFQDSDSDVKEDNKTSNEFMADLNAEYHERALLANQKRFYKRSESKVTLDQLLSEQVPSNIVKALGGKGRRKENNSKEVLYTKADVSTSESAPMITFDSEDDSDNQDYLKRSIWYLDSGCSRHMAGVKQYLHRYSKESGPKVVFGDNSSGDIERYDAVNCNGITFTRVVYVNACKKWKHHRATFKPKRSFSINKCLHLLHMDLFGPVKPQTISHKKYTLVIVDEYSRYTWVFYLKKKSDAANCIMSFIRQMENLNDTKVKQLRSDNETEFRNHTLEAFCDEKGISQNFSSRCTPEQNGVAERRNIPKRRKEMKETFHVTFSEVDEAISQTSTEGDAINFNEVNSFPDDEFKDSSIPNIEDVVPALDEAVHHKSVSIESTNLQEDDRDEPIIDQLLLQVNSPLADSVFDPLVPQDKWSREKHIDLVNIIGEPLAGIAGFESRLPMLNKENYVPWSSRLLRRMIPEPGDTNREVPVNETFYVQTDDELTEKELKQVEADDQAIQTILLGLPEDIYAAVDSCETAQEIWLRVQQMMKGSDIGIQEKKAKLFNEWERFTSNERESIESYYHCFLKLMKDLKRNKHFPEKNAIDLDEIEEVNTNCILMANLQQASTSGTQTDKAPIYDSDGSAEVHDYKNCNDNEIFNMFTHEEQYSELLEPILKTHQVPQNDNNVISEYSELLEPILETHQVPQNDNNVISEVTSVEQSGETLEQHPANFKETHALYDSLYQNLAIEVEKVNTVNRKLKETNADLTTELARFKNQEKYFEISQEKYDKLERCYQ
nr:Rop guanine nucleotide exchange factor 14-like isoform X1 [Tanacetum cinerariifolium]